MLTAGDDYPIHQTPEPVALVTDRNFYDRFFWNGSSPDGSLFFAAALGVYPALDVIDGAFCVCVDGVQHNVRFSARLNGERMAMAVGPLRVEILAPLNEVRIRLAPNDGTMTAELTFTGRHFPIEEPRFSRRVGTRLFMDYTRMTQNGRWSGWIDVAGDRHLIDAATIGTRDRSWGIRPVGKADSQPAPMPPQFWWLWTPTQFDHTSLFLHSNDDGEGRPWNRRAVLFAEGGARGGDVDVEAPGLVPAYAPGSRRIASVSADLGEHGRLTLTPVPGMGGRGHFYMSGLGYTHPLWGHGHDHGTYEEGYDSIDLTAVADNDPALMHIQALTEAVLEVGGKRHVGRGVIEQLFIGQHAASGLTGLFDPFAG
jgi:hypothetical protein